MLHKRAVPALNISMLQTELDDRILYFEYSFLSKQSLTLHYPSLAGKDRDLWWCAIQTELSYKCKTLFSEKNTNKDFKHSSTHAVITNNLTSLLDRTSS